MKYELHPACAMWPQMSDNEIQELAADIKHNGQKLPITLFEDQLLDGRSRALACEMADIEPVTEIYSGDDPVGFTISMNLKRRHLTSGQRAMMATEIANMKQGQRTDLPSSNSRKVVAQEEAAKALGVGLTSVYEAKKIKDSGDAGVIEEVKSGKISLHKAKKKMKASSKAKPNKKEKLEDWNRQQNEAAINAALRRAGTPKITDEEFERPPPELINQQYPGRPPGVTYGNVHREEHGPIWHNVSKRRQQTLVLKLKEMAADLEKAIEDFGILNPEQQASVRKRWRIAAGRIRGAIDLSKTEDADATEELCLTEGSD